MAELTLLVNSTDTALLNGSAVPPAAGSAAGGAFASVLGGQLTQGAGVVPREPPPSAHGPAAAENGETTPLNGKPLPVTAVPVVMPPVTVVEPQALDTTLLAAIAQGLPSGSVASTNTPLVGVQPPVPEAGLLARDGALPASLPQRALLRSVAENSTPARPVNTTATPNTLLNTPSNQVNTSPTPRIVPPVLADVQQLTSAPAIPSVLGKPISEAARQSLARLGQNVGNAKSLRADVTTTVGGTPLNNGQRLGVPNNVSGMNAAIRLDVLNAASNNTTQVATELRLATQPQLNPSALADETINTQFGVSRLSAAPLTGTAPTLAVATPLGQPAWANDIGQRVTWLANNELREAKLQLNPRNLGTVEVRIAYGLDQQLSVSFTTTNPIARDALDASLPRLREMLEQQGLQLADANISHESPEEREQRKATNDAAHAHDQKQLSDNESGAALVANVPASQWLAEGMLDAYA